jgi:pyruvate/2-oxoglutarate dehydrogenase complex dihydrolipoamide dehydrogenase (E3) component
LAETLTPDICVIGAGYAGLTVCAEARALGASVVLVERGELGGDRVGTGTVPARAIAAAAAHAQAVRTGAPFGIAADEPRINTRRVHDHVIAVMSGIAPNDAAPRLEALGVELVKGVARFTDARTLAAGEVEIKARRFVIATGATSVVAALPGLDGVPYFTAETIFDNTRKLTHLAIIGGGAVALELAQSHRRLGSQVTVVEAGTVLAGFDPELAAVALQRMREEGVDIRENVAVLSIQARSQGIGVTVRSGEREEMLDVSHILIAGDRLPEVAALDLDKAGIKRRTDDAARLQLGPSLKTTNPRVYAVGDATGGPQYPHAAAYQARLVARSALTGLSGRENTDKVPRLAYTDPEIAEVGPNEATAQARFGSNFRVVRGSFADNDRARAGRVAFGLVKLLVGRDGTLIGAGVVGERAAELIATLSLAVSAKVTVRDLGAVVVPHPSFSELIQRLAREYSREQAVGPLMQRLVSVVRFLP